jgi:hypothetical protein
MLSFRFCLITDLEVDGYCLGNLIVESDKSEISSSLQPFMLFLSLTTLLDGVRVFLSNDSLTEYTFCGIDSGFQIYFSKEVNFIEIRTEHRSIGVFSASQIVEALWQGIENFFLDPQHKICCEDIAYDDLMSALHDFSEEFSLSEIHF